MLTIYRKLNESIYIGDKKIVLIDIKNRSAVINFDEKNVRIKHGQHISIGTTDLYVLKVMDKKIEFGFDGPRTTTILRGELYEKGSAKYIDNSTKQFPSGDF